MVKLISVDLKSDFGFFRKPDANNTINLSYNMLHKPALLGILGAIIGLGGYSQAYNKEMETALKKGEKRNPKFPEYYEQFKEIKIGIEPLKPHENGNFQKTVIKYSNTIGYANKSEGAYLTEESTLIKPSYKIYLLLDTTIGEQLKLQQYLKDGKAEYIPYFGKNEFQVWWEKESFMEYNEGEYLRVEKNDTSFRVSTLFTIKEDKPPAIDSQQEESARKRNPDLGSPFIYFERLPSSFDEILVQYKLEKFVYSNYLFKKELELSNLFKIISQDKYVQLH